MFGCNKKGTHTQIPYFFFGLETSNSPVAKVHFVTTMLFLVVLFTFSEKWHTLQKRNFLPELDLVAQNSDTNLGLFYYLISKSQLVFYLLLCARMPL